jgi:DnaJ-class molecular chaperone
MQVVCPRCRGTAIVPGTLTGWNKTDGEDCMECGATGYITVSPTLPVARLWYPCKSCGASVPAALRTCLICFTAQG